MQLELEFCDSCYHSAFAASMIQKMRNWVHRVYDLRYTARMPLPLLSKYRTIMLATALTKIRHRASTVFNPQYTSVNDLRARLAGQYKQDSRLPQAARQLEWSLSPPAASDLVRCRRRKRKNPAKITTRPPRTPPAMAPLSVLDSAV